MNALLELDHLPRFDTFLPEQIEPAIDLLLNQAQRAVIIAQTATPTWSDFYEPMELALERLQRAWGMVNHLNAVDDSAPLRQAYEAKLADVTAFFTALGQNQALFDQYKRISQSADFTQWPTTRQRIVTNTLRDFVLSGAALTGTARERYAQIQELLAQLSQDFSKHVLDATNGFHYLVTQSARLDGLPPDVIEAAAADARSNDQQGWRFTLRMPSYLPVMQYAHDAPLRKMLYEAYVTRASEFGDIELNNAPLIDQILALRHEQAKLLGFDTYAQLSLQPKMANDPEEVLAFLRDLGRRAKPFAAKDMQELAEFSSEHLGLNELNAWDVLYASEKLKEARYFFSDQQVKQYFQVPNVLAGLFALVSKLFGVKITPDHAPTWHPDVQFFKLERHTETGTALVGQFFVDLYARQTKRGGAWMDDARGRAKRGQTIQTPIAYLNCNFTPPVQNKPGLLTHDEVVTLFHETGHGLHHLLTRVDDLSVSGINGVEWDAVELPSQFMENFCWDWDVLQSMSSHIQTGEALPRELFNKMIAAKNFQSAMGTVRQLEFGLFDMRIHHQIATANNPQDRLSVQTILDQVRDEVAVVLAPQFNRFQTSFSHIFAGGYSAGYYSYKWAEVLSADCYAAFEEAHAHQLSHTQMGEKFLAEILSMGGSRPAIDSFRSFRGRDPQIDALLKHNGMTDIPQTA